MSIKCTLVIARQNNDCALSARNGFVGNYVQFRDVDAHGRQFIFQFLLDVCSCTFCGPFKHEHRKQLRLTEKSMHSILIKSYCERSMNSTVQIESESEMNE